jgi:hypothetical protein
VVHVDAELDVVVGTTMRPVDVDGVVDSVLEGGLEVEGWTYVIDVPDATPVPLSALISYTWV